MFDRAAILGLSGTAASLGLSAYDSLIGIAAGVVTLVYMSVKLYQEI